MHQFNKVCIQISVLFPHICEHADGLVRNWRGAMHKILALLGMLLQSLVFRCPENFWSMVLHKKLA